MVSLLQNPVLLFSVPGVYAVRLTVSNNSGSSIAIQSNYITCKIPTNIDSEIGTNQNLYTVYPNPAENELNIKMNTNNEIQSLKLLNNFGIDMMQNIPVSRSSDVYNLSVTDLPSGVYVIEIQNNGIIFRHKLVKY